MIEWLLGWSFEDLRGLIDKSFEDTEISAMSIWSSMDLYNQSSQSGISMNLSLF